MSTINLINTLKCIWRSGDDQPDVQQYRQLWKRSVILTVIIAIIPVIILLLLHNYQYYQYKKALEQEMMQEVSQVSLSVKQSVEMIFKEYALTLKSVLSPYSSEELAAPKSSEPIFEILKKKIEGIIGLSLKARQGRVLSQAGNDVNSALVEEEKKDEPFYDFDNTIQIKEAVGKKGHEPFIYILYTPRHEEKESYKALITLKSPFDDILSQLRLLDNTDIFITNFDGVILTHSQFYGDIGELLSLLPHLNYEKRTPYRTTDSQGRPVIVNVRDAEGTPFRVIVIRHHLKSIQEWFSLNKRLLILFGFSTIFGFTLIMGMSASLVCRIRKADHERAMVIQNVEIEHINKLASIGRLSSGVAHEINNPLAVIYEQSGLMLDIISFTDDFSEKERFKEIIASITRSVNRCSAVTHRLLGFAKHFDVVIEDIDLNSVINDIISFLEKEAAHKNITLTLSLPDEPPIIESDRGQLEQVFLNIINNAFDAVSDDGGTIAISIEEYKSTNSKDPFSSHKAYAVSISDDGEGIAEHHLKTIFEPFFTTKKTQGTGLGLSITHGIVHKLGGRIDVHSKVGKGARFTVILPKNRLDNEGKNGTTQGPSC